MYQSLGLLLWKSLSLVLIQTNVFEKSHGCGSRTEHKSIIAIQEAELKNIALQKAEERVKDDIQKTYFLTFFVLGLGCDLCESLNLAQMLIHSEVGVVQ